MRYQGKVSQWNDERGFGFIQPNGGGGKVFLHIGAFSARGRRPLDGEIVTYELATDQQGRAQARNARPAGQAAASPKSVGSSRLPVFFAAAFVLLLVGAALLGRLPIVVVALYAIASVVTFVAYGFDKSAAGRESRRTPENTLHFFALLGGWPGALAAQRLFRHKVSKAAFQRVYWATVVLNCAALGWYLFAAGSQALNFRTLRPAFL